jgi:hypothetical protein
MATVDLQIQAPNQLVDLSFADRYRCFHAAFTSKSVHDSLRRASRQGPRIAWVEPRLYHQGSSDEARNAVGVITGAQVR